MDYILTIFLSLFIFIFTDRFFEIIFKYGDQTTYYFIHFLFNIGIVILYFPCVIANLTDISILNTYSSIPVSLVVGSFQLYHSIIYFKFLRYDDWLHHIMAWFIILNILFIHDPLGYGCVSYFFQTGAPGLLYYGPLFCLKNGWISKNTEITIQYYTNVYIRAPGINFAGWSIVICYVTKHYIISDKHLLLCIFNMLITIWNAQYFTSLTTKAYYNFQSKKIE